MSKKVLVILSIIIIILLGMFFFLTGRARTDVYLKDFDIDEKCNIMTLKVGVSSSAGYVRKMKRTSGSMNYYFTFYSTFGINSKLGAKDTFEILLDKNVDEIYFYTGGKGYKKVLEKNKTTGEWGEVTENNNTTLQYISDGTNVAEQKDNNTKGVPSRKVKVSTL